MGNSNVKQKFAKEFSDFQFLPEWLEWHTNARGHRVPGPALATGTQGTVYKSVYGGHAVAIKEFHSTVIKGARPNNFEIPDDMLKEFFNEVRALHNLHHPSCLGLYGVCVSPTVFFVAEYCPGALSHVLFKDNTIDGECYIRWAKQVASGMDYLHSREIVHCDLKPENVLLTTRNVATAQAKLCDFGLAKFLVDIKKTNAKGTMHYMAPELLKKGKNRAKNPDLKAADVYSFAMLLWVLYTREQPYFDQRDLAVTPAVIEGRRPFIPNSCPNQLTKLMRSCWHSDPTMRPNFSAVRETLAEMDKEFDGGRSFHLPRAVFPNATNLRVVKARQSRDLTGEAAPPPGPRCADDEERPVFGVPLEEMDTVIINAKGLAEQPHPVAVPRFMHECWKRFCDMGGLQVMGVFRLSPAISETVTLKQRLDICTWPERVARLAAVTDVHSLTRLIKDFFRELPDGMFRHMDGKAMQRLVWTEKPSLVKLRDFLRSGLSARQRELLEWLLDRLCELYSYVEYTQMGKSALARTWAPALNEFHSSRDLSPVEMLQHLAHSQIVKDFIKVLISVKLKLECLVQQQDDALSPPLSPRNISSVSMINGASAAPALSSSPSSPSPLSISISNPAPPLPPSASSSSSSPSPPPPSAASSAPLAAAASPPPPPPPPPPSSSSSSTSPSATAALAPASASAGTPASGSASSALSPPPPPSSSPPTPPPAGSPSPSIPPPRAPPAPPSRLAPPPSQASSSKTPYLGTFIYTTPPPPSSLTSSSLSSSPGPSPCTSRSPSPSRSPPQTKKRWKPPSYSKTDPNSRKTALGGGKKMYNTMQPGQHLQPRNVSTTRLHKSARQLSSQAALASAVSFREDQNQNLGTTDFPATMSMLACLHQALPHVSFKRIGRWVDILNEEGIRKAGDLQSMNTTMWTGLAPELVAELRGALELVRGTRVNVEGGALSRRSQ